MSEAPKLITSADVPRGTEDAPVTVEAEKPREIITGIGETALAPVQVEVEPRTVEVDPSSFAAAKALRRLQQSPKPEDQAAAVKAAETYFDSK